MLLNFRPGSGGTEPGELERGEPGNRPDGCRRFNRSVQWNTVFEWISLVTAQPVYLTGSFNNVPYSNGSYPPTSVYAPDLRYGIDGAPVQINMTGQVSISQVNQSSSTAINPLSFSNAAGTTILGVGNSYKLNAITNPRGLPPIMRLNLLFTIEKERPN